MRTRLVVSFLILLNLAVAELARADKSPLISKPAITAPSKRDLIGYQERVLGFVKTSAETLRVLALRVGFQVDDLATTTGDGTFDLSTTSDVSINPPPHNRTYFENQLQALAHYYATVSHHQLSLSYEVYPKEEGSSYQLPNEMKYYSGDGDEAAKPAAWAELLADAVEAADSQGSIDFSQFDSYFVFHAGVGADFSLDFDPTPYDIQSVFLDFETLRSTLGADDPVYQGISVNGGQHFVQDGLILPETETQEGVEIGMLGTMTLLFGAQLGLPSLNDTEGSRPGIGRWGLMDQGSANLQGLVPAQPCAWSRVFLGWEDPIVVSADRANLQVAAPSATNPNRVYKIPVDAKEYFLLENRQRDMNHDGRIIGYDADGSRVEILEDGRLLPIGWSGTIVRFDEYDFGLPGSGILIWHIDERVIETGLAENRVNVDIQHRGVDLEECDAAQDIGHYFGFPTYDYDSGDYWDVWWSGNESHTTVNETDAVAFTPTSMPNSNAYSGVDTHIRITNFSDVDSVMAFDVRTDLLREGFPQFTGAKFGRNAIAAYRSCAPTDTNDVGAMIAASLDGRVFAWFGDGRKVISNSDSIFVVRTNGDTSWYPVALFATVEDSILLSPILADIDGDGGPEVLVASKRSELFVWKMRDADQDGRADLFAFAPASSEVTSELAVEEPELLPVSERQGGKIYYGDEAGEVVGRHWDGVELAVEWQTNLAGGPVVGIALSKTGIVAATATGVVACLGLDGHEVWRVSTNVPGRFNQPVVADFDGDGQHEIAVALSNGSVRCFELDGSDLTSIYPNPQSSLLTFPAVGDMDDDGYPEVVIADRAGVRAFEYTGVLSTDFSISYSPEFPIEAAPSSPIVADMDGDGVVEIVLYIPEKSLMALKARGASSPDLQFSVGGEIVGTPALYDLGEDGIMDLIALSDDGYLYVWNTKASYSDQALPWPQHRGDAAHTASSAISGSPTPTSGAIFADRSVYCYPNPTEGNVVYIRYRLTEEVDNVSVRIYDLTGEFVTEIKGTAFTTSDNEVPWGLDGIESGVYLARVEAVASGKNRVEFIKIAVVK